MRFRQECFRVDSGSEGKAMVMAIWRGERKKSSGSEEKEEKRGFRGSICQVEAGITHTHTHTQCDMPYAIALLTVAAILYRAEKRGRPEATWAVRTGAESAASQLGSMLSAPE